MLTSKDKPRYGLGASRGPQATFGFPGSMRPSGARSAYGAPSFATRFPAPFQGRSMSAGRPNYGAAPMMVGAQASPVMTPASKIGLPPSPGVPIMDPINTLPNGRSNTNNLPVNTQPRKPSPYQPQPAPAPVGRLAPPLQPPQQDPIADAVQRAAKAYMNRGYYFDL